MRLEGWILSITSTDEVENHQEKVRLNSAFQIYETTGDKNMSFET